MKYFFTLVLQCFLSIHDTKKIIKAALIRLKISNFRAWQKKLTRSDRKLK